MLNFLLILISNSLNGIDNLEFVKKTNYKKIPNTQIKDTEFNLRMNLKIEEDLNYTDQQISKYNEFHDTKQKHYRFKKRYSFETPDTLYRIDLTAVKSTQYDHKSKAYKLANTFKKVYSKTRFVKILKNNSLISTNDVINTNNCHISICKTKYKNKVIILSAIDNLIKGGAGQAIQNMNIKFNFPISKGL